MKIVWMLWIMATLTGSPAYAWQWQDVWKTKDQQAKAQMDAGQYADAAHTFQRSDWRATAAYRAKEYQEAARAYLQGHTADDYYNAGNALAMLGQYQPALQAYDKALSQDPKHQDAQFNKNIVQALLEKQKQENPPKSSNSNKDKSPEQQPSSQSSSDKDQKPSPDKSASKQDQNKASPEPNKEEKPKSDPRPKSEPSAASNKPPKPKPKSTRAQREQQEANEQWLRLIPDDPGGFLREKFLRDHLKRQSEWSS